MSPVHASKFDDAFADIYAIIAKGAVDHRRRSRMMDTETIRHVFWTCCGEAAARGWKARLVPQPDVAEIHEKRAVAISRRDGVGGNHFTLIAGIDVDSTLSLHISTLEIRFEPSDGNSHGAGYVWKFVRRRCIDPLRLVDDSSELIAPGLTPKQTASVKALAAAIESRVVES